jgi:hypothetical protein
MYDVESPAKKALDGLSAASGTYGKMMKDIPANRDPGPSVGGAASAGMSGAMAGASMAPLLATAPTPAVGAGLGSVAVGGAGTAMVGTAPLLTAAPALAASGPPGWAVAAGMAAVGVGAYLLS